MSVTPQSDAQRRRLYRSGWLIAVFAMAGYLLIAFAEQGSAGAGLEIVPDDPLPFARHSTVGIDLTGYSSLDAVQWLEQVDVSSTSIILMPVDGDIVSAFNDPDTYVAARNAVDQLIASGNGAPVALCLNRPVAAIEEAILAEAAVTALVENYTDRITYIGACGQVTSPSWEASVLDLLNQTPAPSGTEHLLAPVSVGAPIRLQAPVPAQNMTPEYLDEITGTEYAALRLPATTGLDDDVRQIVAGILHDRAHVATVLASPVPGSDPAAFVGTLQVNSEAFLELSEGFNNISSPQIEFHGDWVATEVGPVTYQRTSETGAWLTTEFIGTEIWAVGIVSPDAGRLGIWVDAENGPATGEPDQIIDLSSTQARDASVLLIDGLPAARHKITLVAADGDVALSGIFVTGRAEAGWHGALGAFGMMLTAMGGLAVVLMAAVDDLRRRIGLDRDDHDNDQHPRVFWRDL